MLALVAISVVVVLIISFVLDNPGFVPRISSAMDTLQWIQLPFNGDLPSGGIGQGRNRLAVTEINSFLSTRNGSSVSLSAYSENSSWDVCVGANTSLGEVEDLLCIVSCYSFVSCPRPSPPPTPPTPRPHLHCPIFPIECLLFVSVSLSLSVSLLIIQICICLTLLSLHVAKF